MKKTQHLCAFLFLFMAFIISSESVALLSTNQGEAVKVSEIKSASLGTTIVDSGDSSIDQLMGLELETCEDGDEECLQRRLISETHLDYIYTQQHRH